MNYEYGMINEGDLICHTFILLIMIVSCFSLGPLTISNQISFEFSLSFLKFFPIDLKKPLTVLNRESRWVQRTVSNYKP